jgi:hypothetical protein
MNVKLVVNEEGRFVLNRLVVFDLAMGQFGMLHYGL